MIMGKSIKIKTALPGPRSREILARDAEYISTSYTRSYPLVVGKAEDVWITDPDGNVFLDFAAGIVVCATGHCHPKVVKAIKKQADNLIHMSGTDFYYPAQSELAERLAGLMPGENRVHFSNSGTEAVEAALKLARWYTHRPINIAFHGAFHGRTMGSLSLTGSKHIQKDGFYPMLPDTVHVPYAHCYRCPYNLSYSKCNIECIKYIKNTVFKTIAPPSQVAAIFVEPIQGEGGYIVPPIEFIVRLRQLCDDYGILLVFDEVQSGMGRTGKMFAYEHANVVPDILTLAKGIASGMPLGATIARKEIMYWPPGAHASTFGGNPIACRAALATIDLLEDKLIENAAVQGKFLKDSFHIARSLRPCIGDVRGEGLMVAVEIVDECGNKNPVLRDKIVDEAFYRGLLLLGCGENSIRFSPPLTVTTEHARICVDIVREAIDELT